MWIWIIVLAVLIVIEFITPIELVSIWFMPAVIITALASIFGASMIFQIVLFGVISVIGLILMVLYFRNRKLNIEVNLEKYEGIYTLIKENTSFKIEVNDVVYRVVFDNNILLNEGDKVVVVGIKGNSLVVSKIKGE